MSGCQSAPQKSVPVVTIPQPTLEKTYGDIQFGAPYTSWISYKSINILIDPAQLPSTLPPPDYLLLSGLGETYFGNGVSAVLNKDLKVIAPAGVDKKIVEAGFANAKGLEKGVRLLLKKEGAFLFVSSAQKRSEGMSYLLEFDNGRNVYINGDNTDADSLREFVYDLRDDGKEIHVGIFYKGTMDQLTQIIATLQPKTAYILESSVDLPLLQNKLKDELYDGAVGLVRKGDKITF